MAVLLKHTFQSAIADDGDPNIVGSDEWNANHVGVPLSAPQGRLTLVTATPVMTSDQAAKTTVYYTAAMGGGAFFVPIYDGTNWTNTLFTEVSQATTDSTKSPAACTTNSNYDSFAWDNAGTPRCTRGPAWSSDTSRGTGAGTTELDFSTWFPTNKFAITNGPAANKGTYVGTIRTDGSSQVNMVLGGTGAAGGESCVLGVWNAYNRLRTRAINFDNTDSWAYTTDTWRKKNNNSNNRISFVRGLTHDVVHAMNSFLGFASVTSIAVTGGIGLDSETALSADATGCLVYNVAGIVNGVSHYLGFTPIGFHYVVPLERSQVGGTTNWYGDVGTTDYQKALFILDLMM